MRDRSRLELGFVLSLEFFSAGCRSEEVNWHGIRESVTGPFCRWESLRRQVVEGLELLVGDAGGRNGQRGCGRI